MNTKEDMLYLLLLSKWILCFYVIGCVLRND